MMKAMPWAGAAGAALLMSTLAAAPAVAQEAPAIKALGACGAIADLAAKAACYDTATAALTSAIKSGEIVVVQRKEAQAAQRGAFGFSLPSLAIFDRLGGRSDDKGDRPPKADVPDADGAIRDETGQLQAITTTLKRATMDPLGKWVLELSDGAVWRQTDSETIAPSPRAGAKVEIRRAALGSYTLKVNSGRAIRVKRSE